MPRGLTNAFLFSKLLKKEELMTKENLHKAMSWFVLVEGVAVVQMPFIACRCNAIALSDCGIDLNAVDKVSACVIGVEY